MMKMLRDGIPVAGINERLGVSRQTISNWKKGAKDGEAEEEAKRTFCPKSAVPTLFHST